MTLNESLFSCNEYNVLLARGSETTANAYPRSTIAQLQELLSSSSAAEPDSQTIHFYTAQLVHYGLPTTTTKATAKSRLLKALQEGKLGVPPDVLELEKKLRKEGLAKTTVISEVKSKKRAVDEKQFAGEAKKAKVVAPKASAKPVISKPVVVTAPAPKKDKVSDVPAVKPITVDRTRFKFSDGTFLASADKEHFHPRHPLKQLLNLIPKSAALTPTGKPSTKAPPPQYPTHFWAAQLVHYGLPGSSLPKDAIQNRLQKALKDNVTVPKEISKLEKELKKEGGQEPLKKEGSQQPLKVTKNDKSKAVPAPKAQERAFTFGDGGSYSGDGGNAVAGGSNQIVGPSKPVAKGRTKQTARKSAPSSTRHSLDWIEDDDSKMFIDELESDSEPVVDGEGVSGYYELRCDLVKREWSFVGTDFSLDVDDQHAQTWAKFDIGMWSGVIKFSSPVAINGETRFSWRGSDTGAENIMSFGSGNVGTITFRANGRVEGYFAGMYGDKVEFSGRRGGGGERKLSSEWTSEWNSYNERNYEYANQSRWGGYKGGW